MTFKKPAFKTVKAPDNAIFDRQLLQRHRDRAAHTIGSVDFLFQAVAENMADNLLDINREFKKVLNLSSHCGALAPYLKNDLVIHQDLSRLMLSHVQGLKIQADEEFIPVKNESLDLITSCLGLHWVNDLPGSLIQIKRALKPDGLFLATIFGGDTLTELRQSFAKAEVELTGGISPRISPFPAIKDVGSLLQRAGFALPVVDCDRITVNYSDAFSLMKELRHMGEGNILLKRSKKFTSKQLMMKVAEVYHDMFANDQGRIPATFDVFYILGWAPHESQQKPLKPGSAQMSLADALGQKPPVKR